ncbi:MAG: hypothetical protein AB7S65_04355 [Sulfuricurvum sp.]
MVKENRKKELCIVHIGMPKTGSTSLQESFYKGISDERVSYANLPEASHSGIIYTMFSDRPETYYYVKAHAFNKEQIEAYNLQNRELMIQGFRDLSTSIEIISGEDIYHLKESELEKMFNFLKEYFKKIIIVGYIRSPKSFMESAFQQLVKYHDLNKFDFSIIYHPYRNLARFDTVFGQENVFLWKFDPSVFPNNDITLDFCERLGIKIESKAAIRANETISQEAISILFTYNKYGRKASFGVQDHKLNHLLVEKIRHIGTTRFHFSSHLIETVLANNKTDIEWIENRMNISLRDTNTPNNTEINGEEELCQFAVKSIEELKKMIYIKDMLEQIDIDRSPEYIARLIEILKFQIAKEQNISIAENTTTKIYTDEKSCYSILLASKIFDETFYMNTYKDMKYMKEKNGDLLLHYIRHGEKENRKPNADFDPQWYRETYSDVREAGMNLLCHYFLHGKLEGRKGRKNIENEVIVGKNGWLFLAGESNNLLRYYNEADFFSDATCQEWKNILCLRKDRLSKMNIEYVHIFAPDKLSIYPEFTLETFRHFDAHPINKLFKQYSNDLEHFVINPIVSFKEAKIAKLLYWKTDTHWTFFGCYEAFRLLMKNINQVIPERFFDYSVQKVERMRDLGSKLNNPVAELCEIHSFAKTAQRVYANELIQYKEKHIDLDDGGLHIGSHVIFQNSSLDIIRKRVVIFGDSFCEYRPFLLTAMFAEVFIEVHFIWSTSLDYEYIEKIKPDIVISEIAERFMNRVPDDRFVLSKYIAEKMVTLA